MATRRLLPPFLALSSLSLSAQAAVAADEVTSLPGWTGPLPSRHYSGYLEARNGTHHIHYYLTLSEGDPVSTINNALAKTPTRAASAKYDF
jgi:hypothetical protein